MNFNFYANITEGSSIKPLKKKNDFLDDILNYEDNKKGISVQGQIQIFLDENKIKKYTINKDNSITVKGDVWILKKYKKLPVKFKMVSGLFYIGGCGLETLDGCPETVGEIFNCSDNKLTNLKYMPKRIEGKIILSGNPLESIADIPFFNDEIESCLMKDCPEFSWLPLKEVIKKSNFTSRYLVNSTYIDFILGQHEKDEYLTEALDILNRGLEGKNKIFYKTILKDFEKNNYYNKIE